MTVGKLRVIIVSYAKIVLLVMVLMMWVNVMNDYTLLAMYFSPLFVLHLWVTAVAITKIIDAKDDTLENMELIEDKK